MMISDSTMRGPWLDVVHPGAVWDEAPSGLLIADLHTTLVDLLRFLPWRDAAAVAGAAQQRGLASAEDLQRSVAALHGKRGATQLRRLVGAMLDGAESGPEIDLQLALRQARHRAWQANPELTIEGEGYRPDIAFMHEKIALEYQGVTAHGGSKALTRDTHRHNQITFGQWAVLYLTKETLYDPASWRAFCEQLHRLRQQRR